MRATVTPDACNSRSVFLFNVSCSGFCLCLWNLPVQFLTCWPRKQLSYKWTLYDQWSVLPWDLMVCWEQGGMGRHSQRPFFFFFYPRFLTQPLSSRHCLLSSRAVLWSIGTTDGIQVCLLQQTSDDLSWHQKALAVLVQRNSGCHGYCFGRGITREPALRRAVLSSARLIRM